MDKIVLDDKVTTEVADLIKIAIPVAELPHYTQQLNTVLPSVDVLQELDTSKVATTAQTHGLENVLRKDEPKPGLDITQYPNKRNLHGRAFRVKRFIG